MGFSLAPSLGGWRNGQGSFISRQARQSGTVTPKTEPWVLLLLPLPTPLLSEMSWEDLCTYHIVSSVRSCPPNRTVTQDGSCLSTVPGLSHLYLQYPAQHLAHYMYSTCFQGQSDWWMNLPGSSKCLLYVTCLVRGQSEAPLSQVWPRVEPVQGWCQQCWVLFRGLGAPEDRACGKYAGLDCGILLHRRGLQWSSHPASCCLTQGHADPKAKGLPDPRLHPQPNLVPKGLQNQLGN